MDIEQRTKAPGGQPILFPTEIPCQSAEGVKVPPVSEWKKEYAALKAQNETDYAKLKEVRAEVSGLQNIRKCVEIAQRAGQPEQPQSCARRREQER